MGLTQCYDLDKKSGTRLQLHLFKNVKNVTTIKKNVMEGSWSCAVVQPRLVLHPQQVAAAAARAHVAAARCCLITRTLFTEILYNMSITQNIVQSLSTFGINDGTELLVCFIVSPDVDPSVDIVHQIEGEPCDFNELSTITRLDDVKSVYKLRGLPTEQQNEADMLDIIISRMATKGFVSH